MGYWQGVSRWINTLLLIVVGFIGFDALFEVLDANQDNGIVSAVGAVAGFFLAPFDGMFDEQSRLLTALIAVLGYCLLAAIILAVARSAEASILERRREREVVRERETARPPGDPGTTQRL